MGQKSLAVLLILKILQKYSTKERLLTHKQIAAYLERDYDVIIERKAVARHIENLTAAGYPIEQTRRGVYIEDERDFDDSELRLLIDSVLFSRHISARHAEQLIEKLKRLGSVDLRLSLGVTRRVNQVRREHAGELFYSVDEIGRAIAENKKVKFLYNEYGLDKKLHPVFYEPITISPYQLVAANGHYYVIGITNGTNAIESFRVEKITDICTVNRSRSDDGGRLSSDFDRYISAHPYLYPGEKTQIKLKMDSRLAGELIDAFGDGFKVEKECNGTAEILLQAGIFDMADWAKRFEDRVEVISPQSLRNQLRKIAFPTEGKYFRSQEDRYARCLEYLNEKEKNPAKECYFHFDGIDLKNRDEYKRYTFCNIIELRNNNLADMSFFGEFPQIVKADIEQNPVTDISFLRGRDELSELVIKDTGVTDISWLEGLDGLISLEFNGKRLKDISPIYSLFNLQRLTISCENAMQFDVLRLKRSCPNLQVKLEEFDDVPTLSECVEFYGCGGDISVLVGITSAFPIKERNAAEILTRKVVEAALSYIKNNSSFNSVDIQKTLDIEYLTAQALLNWLAEAGYIEADDDGSFRVLCC